MKPEKQQSIKNARLLLRSTEVGVLSTHSKACDGYPFGSVSTFMSTHEGDVIFYVSDLAQHTKNFDHNEKMCFTVFPIQDSTSIGAFKDPNAGARLSLLGTISAIDKNEEASVSERFFNLYPDSRKYQNTHDFAFYKMHTDRARFIGGFGDIHWINEENWRLPTPAWNTGEQGMIQHMNEDHVDAMQAICAYYTGTDASAVSLLAINPDGAFYRCEDKKPCYIPFERLATESMDIRKILVEQTNVARKELGIEKSEKIMNHA